MDRMKWGGSVVAAAGAIGWTATASAEPQPQRHDGFYFQLQAGLGYLNATSKEGEGGTEIKTSYKGLSLDTAILLGGSPMPGLAVGGMIMTDYVPSPTGKLEGGGAAFEGDLEDVKVYLIGLGPFVDFYPDPTQGLHFQVMAGWGGLERSYQGDVGGSDPTGLVLNFGGGYDWWIGDSMAVGVMGRFVYAPLKINDARVNTVSPGIIGTLTFN